VQLLALAILIAAGGWLIAAGGMMALKPRYALNILSLTASSHRVNMGEQIPRLIAGAAMVVRADASKLPPLFEVAGWFIAASSIVLLLVPLAWHSGYAKWWAKRIPPLSVRLLAPFSMIAGAGLIYAAWG